ncbi:MAG: hypothetical protein FWD58_07535 [Firmicutes bacterium]|nr:hypothetical protein [Bacillota bacterium]
MVRDARGDGVPYEMVRDAEGGVPYEMVRDARGDGVPYELESLQNITTLYRMTKETSPC